ncbi:methyltransferase domain-containing protein [Streptomyces sp. NPDC001107]
MSGQLSADAGRVLEIGCGPGAAAREVARRVGEGHVHAIDRSPRAIAQAVAGSEAEIASGRLTFQRVAAQDFILPEGDSRFDLAFAVLGPGCVEVAIAPAGPSATVHVRDSKNRDGARLAFADASWVDFVAYAAGS